jgi:hypothetical protein
MAVRTVTIDRDYYSKNTEIWDWCSNRFAHGTWNVLNAFGWMRYEFNNEEDYTLFVLTWGEFAADV